MKISTRVILGIVSLVFLAGCGGSPAGNQPPPPPGVTVTVTPSSATVQPGGVQQFTAAVSPSGANQGVTWSLSGAGCAGASCGTVDSSGKYTAPPTVPNPRGVVVTARSVADATKAATATVTVTGNLVPTINSLSPNSAAAGSPPFTLTVHGTNFIAESTVNFGGTAHATTFVSTTQLTAAIPAAAIAMAGNVPVTVTNPAPGGGTSNAVNFTITSGENPFPTINYLSPDCSPVGGQAFRLLVNGSNFVGSSVVRWNGSDRPTSFLGDRNLIAQISAGDVAADGTATVTVFNPAPGGGSSNASTFTTVTEGAHPTSIAVDPTGKFAYVASPGCGGSYPDNVSSNGKVSMYTIDANTGTLTFTGTVADDFCPHAVTVDPFGKFAYVANYGGGYCGYTPNGFTDGSVSMYTIDPTTGALTSIGPPIGAGTCANSVAVDPSGKFVYVAYSTCGDDFGGVPMYKINATTGVLTLIGTKGAGDAPMSVAVHPSGKFAYVSSYLYHGSNNLFMFTIDASTGALVSMGAIAGGSSIAIHPSGKFAYVAGSNNILMYTVNATTGALTSIGTTAEGLPATDIAFDPSGKFAYVTSSNNVAMYTVDATTGVLTSLGTVAAGLSPRAIAIGPSGKFAYVTNSGSNDVSMYSIDADTGALTLIGTIGT